jgi:hypothetical protein
LTSLVTKQEAGRPLYLAIALEDLRVFGSFLKLDKKIKDLPGDLKGLLEMVRVHKSILLSKACVAFQFS